MKHSEHRILTAHLGNLPRPPELLELANQSRQRGDLEHSAVDRRTHRQLRDCSFAQAEGIEHVHPSMMWAKFESPVEGARLASKELCR